MVTLEPDASPSVVSTEICLVVVCLAASASIGGGTSQAGISAGAGRSL